MPDEGVLQTQAILSRRLAGHPLQRGTWTRWVQGLIAGEVEAYHHAALLASLTHLPLATEEAREVAALLEDPTLPDDFRHLPDTGLPSLSGIWPEPREALPRTLYRALKGETLTEGEIEAFVAAVADDSATDAQIATFTAAIFLHGMAPPEVATLTRAMTFTGSLLDIGEVSGPIVDKHSTGGVGDKVSLPLAAVLAAGGCFVPMVSGRGLGHTGGTLDKLQCIPGYRVNLSAEEIAQVVRDVGCSIVGQTQDLAPADRRIYAIRDVTGTVSSIPLITASILSKKLAEDLEVLLMDVKVGSGAFMPTLEGARDLAESLTRVGEEVSRSLPERPGRQPLKVRALLTAMDRPLGRMVGHTLEVKESLDCLKGGGPEDLRRVVMAEAGRIFAMGGIALSIEEGEALAGSLLDNGQALLRFRRMVQAHGGDASVIDHPDALGTAPITLDVKAPRDGHVLKMDALTLGQAVLALGGGRRSASDRIDYKVGLEIHRPFGAEVSQGDVLLTIHARDQAQAEEAHEAIHGGILIGAPGSADAPDGYPLIIEERP